MADSRPKWVIELHSDLLAEIAGIESGLRIYEQVGRDKREVTTAALVRLRARLAQVENLLATYYV